MQRAQQGAARALFPILSPILPDFRKGKLARFSAQKNINNIPNLYPDLGLLLPMTERRSGQSHHLTQDQVQGGTSLMLRIIMLRIIMQSSAADNDVVQ